MQKIFSSFIISALLALGGCAHQTFEIEDGKLPELATANSGYLMVALTANGDKQYDEIGLLFHSLDGKIKDKARVSHSADMKDHLLAFALPPGNYEIYNLYMYENGIGDRVWYSKTNFSIPFTIASGKATYIGDFKNIMVKSKSIIGEEIPNGGYFIVSDHSARDLPAMKEKFPFLDLNNVTIAVRKSGNIQSGLVQFQ